MDGKPIMKLGKKKSPFINEVKKKETKGRA